MPFSWKEVAHREDSIRPKSPRLKTLQRWCFQGSNHAARRRQHDLQKALLLQGLQLILGPSRTADLAWQPEGWDAVTKTPQEGKHVTRAEQTASGFLFRHTLIDR